MLLTHVFHPSCTSISFGHRHANNNIVTLHCGHESHFDRVRLVWTSDASSYLFNSFQSGPKLQRGIAISHHVRYGRSIGDNVKTNAVLTGLDALQVSYI